MFVGLWTAKGGSGSTVVSIGLAAVHAARGEPVLLVDLDGDLPAALGLAEPAVGLAEWLDADSGTEALGRLELPVAGGAVSLLPRGRGEAAGTDRSTRLTSLVDALRAERRVVVVDAGVVGRDDRLDDLRAAVLAACDRCVLVTRPCYLAVRRAVQGAVVPDSIVLVREVGRSLDRHDLERVVGAPVVAQLDLDPAVARLVDAGQLIHRAPRTFTRPLRRVA